MAFALLRLLGTSRRIVETWLYIEVALVLGTGILGLGHHYFWIGTPDYWLTIGGFFSALEPLPLLGMVVHAVYDAGAHHTRTTNRPALYWMMPMRLAISLAPVVWGFMITLPQVNLYADGTQWTASHEHLAFWGAYACGVISVLYLVLQKTRNVLKSMADCGSGRSPRSISALSEWQGRRWFGLCSSLCRAGDWRFDIECVCQRPGKPLGRRRHRRAIFARNRLCGAAMRARVGLACFGQERSRRNPGGGSGMSGPSILVPCGETRVLTER